MTVDIDAEIADLSEECTYSAAVLADARQALVDRIVATVNVYGRDRRYWPADSEMAARQAEAAVAAAERRFTEADTERQRLQHSKIRLT